ncbi:hypothetical protein PENSPDRAFT_215732 [Peniophora sp. CONT]|nr:hypothetical protein PENSPDRAFT_215732 [Peniophora sp. CONT]
MNKGSDEPSLGTDTATAHLRQQLEQTRASLQAINDQRMRERQVHAGTMQRLEAERDMARAERRKASEERAQALGRVAAKDREIHALRARLASRDQGATTLAAPRRLGSVSSGRVERAGQPAPPPTGVPEGVPELPASESAIPNRRVSPAAQGSPLLPQAISARPRTDATTDPTPDNSDDEAFIRLDSRARATDHLTASARILSMRDASRKIAGPSTSTDTAKRTRRSLDEAEVGETSKAAKRARNSAMTPAIGAFFDYGPTKAVVDAVPASLRHRVANMHSIKPTEVPANKLPTAANPTVGWVKRVLFEEKYGARQQLMNTQLRVFPSQLMNPIGPVINPDAVERMEQRNALFVRLDKNPGLPTYPGEPGTIITSRTDIPLDKGPVLVVVKSMEAFWQCVGLYSPRVHHLPVSAQEWKDMSDVTRNCWAETLSSDRNPRPHQRIAIRLAMAVRQGRHITDDEVEREVAEYYRRHRPDNMRPTPDEVLQGLDEGYDTLGVVMLEPVSACRKLYEEIWDRGKPNHA